MAWGKAPQMFTGDQLTSLLTESETCADVLDFLVTKERQQTELTLSRPGLAPDYVTQMVLVLLKASQCKTNEVGVIDLLAILVGSKFFMCELVATSSTFICHSEAEDALRFIDNLVELLHQVHQLLPNLFNNAFSLIIILKKKTEDILMTSTEEQRQRVVKLSEKLSEMRDNVMKVLVSCSQDDPRFPFERQAPPDDFRNIPILPRVVDIFLRSRGAFLRKNKSRGGYDDLNHYLDVQFRLLREDCICPLREGITQYVQETSTGCHVRLLQNGRLYRNVEIKKHGHHLEGELFEVTLDSQHAKKIYWESSKRLLHGSLLCFSADNFHTMEFAVVESPDRQMLAESYTFPVIFPTIAEIQLNTKYTMIESSAFFEKYRHVLEGLQSIEQLPLEQYIVDCKNSIILPRYLQKNSSKYDLEPIASGRLLITALDAERKTENILQVRLHDPMSQWPTADVLHLDQSQYVAYHAALTQEFVLIQGPPGTGKTHVGIQIVKTLLHNKNVWSHPSKPEQAGLLNTRPLEKNSDQKNNQLLVVCFTNHALDQFLEGIVGCFEGENKELLQNEIVRVGSQCKNPTIEPFNLKNHKKNLHCDYTKLAKLRETATQLHTQLLTNYISLRNLQTTILEFEILRPVMSQRHANAFVCDTPHASSQKFYQWLQAGKGPWLKKASQAYRKSLKTTKQPKHDHANRKTTVNQDFIDTEADKAEEERRIDDDDLHLATKVKIGLDIKEEIKNIMKPKHEYMPQIDDALKSFLKQEADITLSKLCSVNMMRAMEVKSLSGSLNKLKLGRRWRLYRFWVDTYKKMQLEQMPHVEKEHLQIMKDYKNEKKESDARIFKKSTVIAMTTTGAARYHDILQEIGPKIVIVEEAAEVLEAHIVTALSRKCEHLILIGDHKQLEPKPSVMQLAMEYNLSLSMFERMLNNGIENHCLQRQHRMRPEISTLVRDIYPVLEDNENVLDYEHIKGVEKDVFFINHNRPEDYTDDIKSYSNRHEAQFISELCRYLLKQGYKGNQITVLAAYTCQMFSIRHWMAKDELKSVKTVAIDNFQGEENDIILLSLVRSNKEGNIGFLSRSNRICVALSRAKKGLYVIGNFDMFVARSSQWSHIVNKVKQAEQFGDSLPLFCQNHPHEDGVHVTASADFARAPNGGCQIPCGFILPCGHSCRLACHPMDRQHTAYKCKKVCTETCPNGHPCNKPCHLGKSCNCQNLMKKPLPCGHVTTVRCYEFSEVCVCSVFVNKVLPCGHQAEMKCHADPARNSCEVLVAKKLVDCGHTAELPCSNVNFDFKCQQKVSLVRGACGHRYQIACHEDSKTFQRENLCQELVTKTFLCMHIEEVMCRGSRYANCIKPCPFQCHHGHSCGKLCHFQTPCRCEFLVEKTLPKCGHQLMIECHSEDDPAWLQVPCEEIVSKVIPLCGHSQNMKCKEFPQTQQCQEIVPKEHPLCGHMVAMMCSLTPSRSMLCKTIVHKTLVCGHKQYQECSASNVTCTVDVIKTMPCGHQQLVPCNRMDAPVTCMKKITKKFPKCGHVTEMFCWASALYLNCLQTITLTKCGHQKTISCEKNMHGVEMEKAERLYKCKLTCFADVTLHFACGHSETTQCHLSETVRQCSDGCCPHILSCGHPCTGKDDDCSEKLVHANCTQPCNKLLVCGHQCKSATCGLCSICSNECERYCPHRKCEHPCSQDCLPCKETCSLQCPHHNCSRLCHEECNRPPCNLWCPLMLKCSHPCMGYCGEPCPSLCIVCEPDTRNEFSQTCNEDIRLVRLLDCGHEHDATLLDKLLNEDIKNTFSVLRCPSCDKVIHWHPRYIHQLKQQWHAIDAVKKILLSCLAGCTKHQRFPMVAGGVSDIRTYLRRLSTFLYLNENLNIDKKRHIKSQEWLRYTIQSLSAFLDDLPIATRSYVFATFNERLRKLTAVQLLIHRYYSKGFESDDSDGSEDDSDDDAADGDHQDDDDDDDDDAADDDDNNVRIEGENGDKSSKHSLKKQHMDHKTSIATDAITTELQTQTEEEIFILIKQTFTQSDLSKFRELLLPFLTDSSEAIQSPDCPELRGVNIHLDDWTRCIKGHVRPSSYAGDNCLECSSGTNWTVEMLHLMKEIRDQIASKKVKDKDGNIRRRQESRQQLEQSTGWEPYVATFGEFTAEPERPQSQFLSQLGDKRRTVKNRYMVTEDDDLWETKNNLGTGNFDLRETEGNGGTGDVGTRVTDRNWRTGKVDPRSTERNWSPGKAEPRATERNWRTGKADPRATDRNWRTRKAEPRVTEVNWAGKGKPRVTEGNWRTGNFEPRATEESRENW